MAQILGLGTFKDNGNFLIYLQTNGKRRGNQMGFGWDKNF